MMRTVFHLLAGTRGAAAAEMALVLPLLLVIMFGAFDLGNYFLAEHVVDKAVRDAARYAARQPLSDFDCGTGAMTNASTVQKIARTGDPAGTIARISGWSSDDMTSVSVTCDTSGAYSGVFADFPDGVPVVTVSATVPYASVFAAFGVRGLSLNLFASQQAVVMGA